MSRYYIPVAQRKIEDWRHTVNKLDEISKFRKLMKMSKVVQKERECLSCSNRFISESSNNRMCHVCRKWRHENIR